MFLVKNSPRGGDNGRIGFPYAKIKGPCLFRIGEESTS